MTVTNTCLQNHEHMLAEDPPQVPLHNQLVLLSIPAADDQVVLTGDEPVELLKPMGLAHMLDGLLTAHLAQLLLCLLLCCFEGLLVGIDCLLLLYHVLLALLIVGAGIGICIEVQIKLNLKRCKIMVWLCNTDKRAAVETTITKSPVASCVADAVRAPAMA